MLSDPVAEAFGLIHRHPSVCVARRAFSFHDQTYKMAEIRKEEHRRLFENWLEKHKDSKKCLVITAEEYNELLFEWYLYQY